MGDTYEVLGTIDKVLGNNNYAVVISDGEKERTVLCHMSGKMRQFNISIVTGDEVTVELPPPYDKGRITFRGQKQDRPAQKKEARRKGKGKKHR